MCRAIRQRARKLAVPQPFRVDSLLQVRHEDTRGDRKDIIVTSINPEPFDRRHQGEADVRATVDAPGFSSPQGSSQVFFDDKEVPGAALDVILTKRTDNEVQLASRGSGRPREIQVTVKISRSRGAGPLDGN